MSQRQGEGGYVQRMEVIVKRKKGQGGGERRSEAFVKIQKKKCEYVNGEVKLL